MYKNLVILYLLLVFSIAQSFAQNTGILKDRRQKRARVEYLGASKNVYLDLSEISNKKELLSEAQKKLSTDLVQLIDQKFLPSSTDLQSHANSLLKLNQLKLFEQGADLRKTVTESSVYVYIFLYEGFTTYSLDGFAGEITNRDEKNNMAVAWVKVKDLEALASLPTVRTIRTVFPPVIRTGSVTTQGDVVHRTSNVRSTYGKDGTGINVGIISDGVTTRSTAQSTGDLPPDGSGLTILSAGTGDEGTALLEIVYDMVPGANLFFHDAGANTAAFNTAIDNLVIAGCDIIVDDIGWISQPFYEDGTVASHVSSVITANDIIYVSSSGNAGDAHYQGDFFPIGGTSTQHDFSEGGTTGFYLYVNLGRFESVTVILQWNDQFGASGNDYDLYLFNLTTLNQVAQSLATQNGNDDPFEGFTYTAPPGGTNDYAILVDNYLGAALTRNLEVFIYPGAGAFNYTNNITPVDAIFGHPAVDNVVSAGAVDWSTPSTIEGFSSQGPSTITYPITDTRQTPKISGVDGVSVTGAGGFPTAFFGTSAAAPHITAILAQAWSYDLLQTGDAVRQLLYDWAVDLGAGGFDNVFGYGRGDALNIFDSALPVELSSFIAKSSKDGIQLDWVTQTEVNNYGFEVERTTPFPPPYQGGGGEAGGGWEKIGFVEGHGNSNSPKNYSFTDKGISYGVYTYRLKQIDNDGTYEYSDEIEIDAGNIPNDFVLEQNYPNPFNPSTIIRFAINESVPASLKIYDVLGNEVEQLFNERTEAGKVYNLEFNAVNLPSGVYYYRLQTGDYIETKKMVLLR